MGKERGKGEAPVPVRFLLVGGVLELGLRGASAKSPSGRGHLLETAPGIFGAALGRNCPCFWCFLFLGWDVL